MPRPRLPRQPSATGRGPVGMTTLAVGPGGSVSTVYPTLAAPHHVPGLHLTSERPKRRQATAGTARVQTKAGEGERSCRGVCVCVGWNPGALKGRHGRHTLPWPHASMQPLGPCTQPAKWSAGLCLATPVTGNSLPPCTTPTTEKFSLMLLMLTQKFHSQKIKHKYEGKMCRRRYAATG